ncbi:uncharacterized protein N7511_002610 [Penicillium nucicola]|uniref:uncharacterized protein n=1 Tax=Penicillium nucicola TaxID=1850975 RepID=UPI002545584C|nr:uncharacterized protein N7511_002610 [Penicillium nucicola]KAJ5770559.1 hypothetical protein N7511_002610 [Penicillium nucicola]
MDAQYPFASRDDIWRVFEELKDLQISNIAQGERIAQLERRRDEDARLRSPWAPTSPFPSSVGTSAPDSSFHSPPDAFKGFDQGHHSTMTTSAVAFDVDEEPRRGTSRANSVRFDESAIHGYGQTNRTSTELPIRTGSGLSSHPLLERTSSHQSDGGHSLHSARTNSLRLNTTRLSGLISLDSPTIPPPALFLLGPVPSIIRCWISDDFTNSSLLYAAVCSGSYISQLSLTLVRNLGMEDLITHEDDVSHIKLPVYLPEALIHQASSRPGTPIHQVPAVTVRFIVREAEPTDDTIQIILGSDVLRAHNANICFSLDKLIMVDDDRNRVSVPLVRPEKDTVFNRLCTSPSACNQDQLESHTNGHASPGVIRPPHGLSNIPSSTSFSASLPISANGGHQKPRANGDDLTETAAHETATNAQTTAPPKTDNMPPWTSWRRETKKATKIPDKREMKVFRTVKSSARTTPSLPGSTTDGIAEKPHCHAANPPNPSDVDALNPVGGASAFGWLNPAQRGSN